MIVGAKVLLKQLDEYKILENAFKMYPHYDLTLTGKAFDSKIFNFTFYSNYHLLIEVNFLIFRS